MPKELLGIWIGVLNDLKLVYKAINKIEDKSNLMAFKEKWEKSYPSCVKSWEDNWKIL